MTIVRTRGNTAKVGIATEDQHLEDVIAGTNISIDKSDPLNPVISATGGTTLTNGNGTTANGSAVDLGGTQSADISIVSDGTKGYEHAYPKYYRILTVSGAQYRIEEDGTFIISGTILQLYFGNGTNGDTYHRAASGLLTGRGVITATSTATLTTNSDTTYQSCLTAQAEALTIANPTGTPFNGQDLIVRVKDNGTARAITFGAQFRAIGTALPTTTTISKTLYICALWNAADSKWDTVNHLEV
jgi:hypothetical protein